jgi:N-acetylmuramic acid 6-phosphate etherase
VQTSGSVKSPVPLPVPVQTGTVRDGPANGFHYNPAMPRRRDLPATEQRLDASRNLHRLSPLQVARLMNRQDRAAAQAVGRVLPTVARAAALVADRLRSGGRLIYVGAGSSGRLAALDAAELPPTFGIPRRRVRVVLAGGVRTLLEPAEQAEDDAAAGGRRIRTLAKRGDAVIGIAASGATPFTVAALRQARRKGCATVAVTVVPGSPLAGAAAIAIVPEVGPEVLTGSTRLKAGTATKMVLNMISTIAMIRLGLVWSNLMVDMPAANAKLKMRARRIVAQATGAAETLASAALDAAAGDARTAIVMIRLGIGARGARQRLRRASWSLDAALRSAVRTSRTRRPKSGR